jgi:hypothetical protein
MRSQIVAILFHKLGRAATAPILYRGGQSAGGLGDAYPADGISGLAAFSMLIPRFRLTFLKSPPDSAETFRASRRLDVQFDGSGSFHFVGHDFRFASKVRPPANWRDVPIAEH